MKRWKEAEGNGYIFPFLKCIFVVFRWMTGRMTGWMTRRTNGWKPSFRPRRALLYKNIRSPFLYLFLVSVFLSFFFVFFAFVFFFHFFFHFFFQIGFLNNNQKVKFHFQKRKKLLIFFLMILSFLFFFSFLSFSFICFIFEQPCSSIIITKREIISEV